MESKITMTKTPRERELDWMEKNKAELEQLKGKWLAIEGEELVASSFNILNVIEETKRRGISVPFLIYVPEEMQRNTMGIVS